MATAHENGPTGAGPSSPAGRVTVTVLGFDGSPPSPAARRALEQATLVIGNIRHLDALPVPERARRIYMGGLGAALTRLALHDGPAVVVASGDPGYFGVVRALREQGLRVRTIPAVSSVATAFGRIGLAWEDAFVVAVDPPADGVDGAGAKDKGKVRTGGRAAKDGGFGTAPGRACAPRPTCAAPTRRWQCSAARVPDRGNWPWNCSAPTSRARRAPWSSRNASASPRSRWSG